MSETFQAPSQSNSTISQWQQAKFNADYWKKEEQRLRQAVVAEEFADKSAGTHSKPLAVGSPEVVKAVIKENIKISGGNTDVHKICTELHTAGLDPLLIQRVFSWEPKLSVSEYNKLPDHLKKIADQVLTIDRAMPTLEIVTPKKGA